MFTKINAYNRIINYEPLELNGEKIYKGAIVKFEHSNKKYIVHSMNERWILCYRKLSKFYDRNMLKLVSPKSLVCVAFNLRNQQSTSECYISDIKYIEDAKSDNLHNEKMILIKNPNIYILACELPFGDLFVTGKNKTEAIKIYETLLKKKYQHYKNYKINKRTVLRWI